MFELARIARLYRSARIAIKSRDTDSILKVATDIADFLGYGAEAAELIAIGECAVVGDIDGALKNLSDLCLLLVPHFASGGVRLMSAGVGPDGEGEDDLEAICTALEAPQTLGAEAVPVGVNPAVILMLIRGAYELLKLIRERRRGK